MVYSFGFVVLGVVSGFVEEVKIFVPSKDSYFCQRFSYFGLKPSKFYFLYQSGLCRLRVCDDDHTVTLFCYIQTCSDTPSKWQGPTCVAMYFGVMVDTKHSIVHVISNACAEARISEEHSDGRGVQGRS